MTKASGILSMRWPPLILVPTLRVGTGVRTLRVPAHARTGRRASELRSQNDQGERYTVHALASSRDSFLCAIGSPL